MAMVRKRSKCLAGVVVALLMASCNYEASEEEVLQNQPSPVLDSLNFTLPRLSAFDYAEVDLNTANLSILIDATGSVFQSTSVSWFYINQFTSLDITGTATFAEDENCQFTGQIDTLLNYRCDFGAGITSHIEQLVETTANGFSYGQLRDIHLVEDARYKLELSNDVVENDHTLVATASATSISIAQGTESGHSATLKVTLDKESYPNSFAVDDLFSPSYVGNPALSFQGSFNGDVKGLNPGEYKLQGGFDFEILRRTDDMVAMQNGLDYFYKFSNSVQSVCAHIIHLSDPEKYQVLRDADCDGIAE